MSATQTLRLGEWNKMQWLITWRGSSTLIAWLFIKHIYFFSFSSSCSVHHLLLRAVTFVHTLLNHLACVHVNKKIHWETTSASDNLEFNYRSCILNNFIHATTTSSCEQQKCMSVGCVCFSAAISCRDERHEMSLLLSIYAMYIQFHGLFQLHTLISREWI